MREGLTSRPKRLPAWLFYDEEGSRLFDAITELPEYYLTRTERGILAAHAAEMTAQAAAGARLHIVELGAGSADKTRVLLKAATELQGAVLYEPVDVSASALEAARERIEREIDGVTVTPRVMDYTHGDGSRLHLGPVDCRERRLVVYIGSSIGNFEPHQAAKLLRRVRAGLKTGDGFLLGVDLAKEDSILLPAYDDAAGVTSAFNRNVLVRLNRELDAEFEPETFAHYAVWNEAKSRIEMHLKSRNAQRVHVGALVLTVEFAAGESIHTENSYKFTQQTIQVLLRDAGFEAERAWSDERGWCSVTLARVR